MSVRDQRIAVKRALDFMADCADKPRMDIQIPPKRERVRRPVDGKPAKPLEAAVNDDIREAFDRHEYVTLFRNNRGVAQYGEKMVRYGVGPKGGSDWIGYRRITITPEMVGSDIAQFCALEAKRPGERPDDDQQKFIDSVNGDGGCAGWADSKEAAIRVLNK